jgi:segregation and condensation protein B
VKSLGHKEVPGRPTLYGTTREFLDYFNLKSLNELPTLAEIRDLDQFNPEFSFEDRAETSTVAETESETVEDSDNGDGSDETGVAAEIESQAAQDSESVEDSDTGEDNDETKNEAVAT